MSKREDKRGKAGRSASGVDAYEVPIVALEEALGTILLPEHMQELEVDLDLCERLYFNLRDFHRRNRLTETDRSVHRPNLGFVGQHSGVLVNTDFDGYKPGSFIPRNGDSTVPMDDVKRSLLLADAVVIEDPVFAFCRAAMCHRFKEARPAFGVLHRALLDLASMRELLEDRLVRLTAYFPAAVEDVGAAIPRRDGAIVIGDVMAATSYQDPRVLRLVAGRAADPNKWNAMLADRVSLIRDLRREAGEDFEWLYQQAESVVYAEQDGLAYGPYLPTEYMYQVFAKLLAKNSERSVDPFLRYITELNSGHVVDPSKIELVELAAIRRSEEVFETWRQTVRNALKEARAGAEKNADKAAEFQHEMQERQREWRARYQRYHKGRLADVAAAGQGIAVGTIGALFKGGEPSFGGLASFFFGPFTAAEGEYRRYAAEGAMVAFFTAVRASEGSPDPHWPGTV